MHNELNWCTGTEEGTIAEIIGVNATALQVIRDCDLALDLTDQGGEEYTEEQVGFIVERTRIYC